MSSLTDVLKEFCDNTSLHGYLYLKQASSWPLKIVWVLIIILMTSVGFVFVGLNTQQYMESRLLTSIDSSTASLSVR